MYLHIFSDTSEQSEEPGCIFTIKTQPNSFLSNREHVFWGFSIWSQFIITMKTFQMRMESVETLGTAQGAVDLDGWMPGLGLVTQEV